MQAVDWGNATDLSSKWLTMEDHCKHMFVAQTEGHAWSGRMKFLLNCRSVLMTHKLHWIELYHHLLVSSGPNQNYVQLEADFSDLEEKMDYYLSHIDEAERIADNSVNTMRRRYLSPAAEACYWRKLIRGWSEVSFAPELYEESDHAMDRAGETVKVRRHRGKPYEGFMYVARSCDLPCPMLLTLCKGSRSRSIVLYQHRDIGYASLSNRFGTLEVLSRTAHSISQPSLVSRVGCFCCVSVAVAICISTLRNDPD